MKCIVTNSYVKQLEEQVASLEQQIVAHNAEYATSESNSNRLFNYVVRIVANASSIQENLKWLKEKGLYFRGTSENEHKLVIKNTRNLMLLLETTTPIEHLGMSRLTKKAIEFIREFTSTTIKEKRPDWYKRFGEPVLKTTILEDIINNTVGIKVDDE